MLLGADQALTNDQVLRADNAAVGLRLLGQRERLVWYVPTLTDLLADDGVSLRSLLPRWIVPGLWILALAMARRDLVAGPPARARWPPNRSRSSCARWRRPAASDGSTGESGDRGHAAASLRRAARSRCAERLRLGSRTTPETLVREVARRTGRDPADVASLLDPRATAPAYRPGPDHAGQRPGRARQRGTPQMTETPLAATATHAEARERLAAVRAEVGKAVVGQDAAVSGLLVALLCGGHVLMEGVPGTAKTLLVRTLASSLDVGTRRVQFTPDLMPGDITGSMVIDSHAGELSFREGPVFTNLLLADEINRTPPKTQSALLEAMEEGQVSVDGVSHKLPDAVPGGRDPEPDRVRGHLPAARGAARPVPPQGRAADPGADRGAGDPAPARAGLRPARRPRRGRHAGRHAGRHRRPGRRRSRPCRSPPR